MSDLETFDAAWREIDGTPLPRPDNYHVLVGDVFARGLTADDLAELVDEARVVAIVGDAFDHFAAHAVARVAERGGWR